MADEQIIGDESSCSDLPDTHCTAVIVLGMHRSGTSALTRALSIAGFTLPRRLLPATADNLEGFWEPAALVALNDRVLAALGQDWTTIGAIPPYRFEEEGVAGLRAEAESILREDYGDARRFVIKDPRMARLVPFWEPVFRAVGARPCFVHPVRNPLEVARSLARRNGFGQTRSLLMWIDHTLAMLQAAHDAPVTFVDFDTLLAWPSVSVEGVLRRLGLQMSLSGEACQAIDAAIKPGLRHQCVPMDALDLAARTVAIAHELHGLMVKNAVCHQAVPVLPPELQDAWTRVVDLQATPGLTAFVTELDPAWRPSCPPSGNGVASGISGARSLLADAPAVLSQLLAASSQPAPEARQPDGHAHDLTYEGHLDCLVGTVLYGWCWRRPSWDRVSLRLNLDRRDAGRAIASQFRADLCANAIGDGWHAFAIDLEEQEIGLRDDMIVHVLTDDGIFVLAGSGKTLAELRAVQ